MCGEVVGGIAADFADFTNIRNFPWKFKFKLFNG